MEKDIRNLWISILASGIIAPMIAVITSYAIRKAEEIKKK